MLLLASMTIAATVQYCSTVCALPRPSEQLASAYQLYSHLYNPLNIIRFRHQEFDSSVLHMVTFVSPVSLTAWTLLGRLV